MPEDTSPPHDSPPSVRTLSGGNLVSCPVCGAALKGRQTVCSPRCRIRRSRQVKAQRQATQDSAVRLHLRQARMAVETALKLLEQRENTP